MKTVELSFLGTGTSHGVPVVGCSCEVCRSSDPRDKRLRTAAMLAVEGKHLVIDIGPDFRQQMLRAAPPRLDGILITHEHNDHVVGLDDVRPFNYIQREDMPVYCTAPVGAELKRRFSYAFDEDPYPGAPVIRFHTIQKEVPFEAAGVAVTPIGILHGTLPILGFRVHDVAYLTDVRYIEEEELLKLQNLDVLVISALFHSPEHHSHLTVPQALSLIERIGPRRAYLTHMSHRVGLHRELAAMLPAGVMPAYDGLKVVSEG